MRFIQVELPAYYGQVVKDVIAKYPKAREIDENFLQDIMFIVALGYDAMWQNMCSVYDLAKECSRLYMAGKIRNIAGYEAELFTMRMDLIDFADSEFARKLKEDPFLRLEEKFEMVVKFLEGTIQSQQLPPSVKHAMQNQAQTQGATAVSGPGQGQGQGGQAAGMGVTSQFFKGFSFMMSHFYDNAVSQYQTQQQHTQMSKGATRDSAMSQMQKELMGNKLKIADMVDKIFNHKYLELFQIAHNMELAFATQKKGKLFDVDHVASNLTVARMKSMKDVNRAVKMDLVAEDVFDRKVMTKQLRVGKFRERKDQKQCLYALLDHSGSTSDVYPNLGISRLMYIKAIAIALGKKAIADGGVFYFRWFEGGVKSLYSLKSRAQWGNFLTHILNEVPAGGTNMDLAIHVASDDMAKAINDVDQADMIVVTDGTEDIHEVNELLGLRKKGMKCHFVSLEEMSSSVNIEKVAETFQVVNLEKVTSLDNYVPDFQKVV